MTVVGFIGLGAIGGAMARRLLATDHELVIYDLDAATLRRHVDLGGIEATSPADVAGRADIVCASLPSPEALRAVALGGDGVHQGDRAAHLIDLSTVGPRASAEVSRELPDRIGFIDAPVSGGVVRAELGQLSIMAAGADRHLDSVMAVLSALGQVYRVGPEAGMGQVLKLANNYLAGAALAATAEAMVVGAKAGLDAEIMIEVLNASSGKNTATAEKFPRSVLPGTFDYGFATGLMHKDVRLFSEEAASLGVPLNVGTAVAEMWRTTSEEVGPTSDFTSVVRPLERLVGVEVRGRSRTTPTEPGQ